MGNSVVTGDRDCLDALSSGKTYITCKEVSKNMKDMACEYGYRYKLVNREDKGCNVSYGPSNCGWEEDWKYTYKFKFNGFN